MTSYLAAPSQYDLTHQHLASGYSYISPTSLHRPSEAYLDPTSHLGPFLASGLPGSGSNSPPSQAQFNTAGTPSTPLFVDESISIRQFKEMADQWAKAAAEGGFVGGQGSMRGGETQGGYYG